MTLSAGTRLRPYEILAQLGAGGMGEVYGGRDMFNFDSPPYADTVVPEPMIEVKNAPLALGGAAAARMMGYGDTNFGILSDNEALKELSRVLDATTAAGKS